MSVAFAQGGNDVVATDPLVYREAPFAGCARIGVGITRRAGPLCGVAAEHSGSEITIAGRRRVGDPRPHPIVKWNREKGDT
jgi:hypothetical protein